MQTSALHLQCRNKRLLRDLDLAELAHLLLARLLLLQQLALAGDVAAIALRGHILSQRLDCLAGNDLAADGRLNRDLEEMLRNEFLELLDHCAPARLGALAVNELWERIDWLAIDQDRHFDEIAWPVVRELIIEARIAFRDRFEPVVKIEDDLIERQVIGDERALACVAQIHLDAAPVLAEF